ncbi:hypothetical protein H0H81_003871 [Sphagnurus paluster]|uniref:Uncharacterized protein n=1 Tax=Sphagnurus paluster TaxID=117069 RepID=A0A9P7FSF5_9AGAR|nr:hypothetical protein H0H81_003871 [Sphagnurus paluster]
MPKPVPALPIRQICDLSTIEDPATKPNTSKPATHLRKQMTAAIEPIGPPTLGFRLRRSAEHAPCKITPTTSTATQYKLEELTTAPEPPAKRTSKSTTPAHCTTESRTRETPTKSAPCRPLHLENVKIATPMIMPELRTADLIATTAAAYTVTIPAARRIKEPAEQAHHTTATTTPVPTSAAPVPLTSAPYRPSAVERVTPALGTATAANTVPSPASRGTSIATPTTPTPSIPTAWAAPFERQRCFVQAPSSILNPVTPETTTPVARPSDKSAESAAVLTTAPMPSPRAGPAHRTTAATKSSTPTTAAAISTTRVYSPSADQPVVAAPSRARPAAEALSTAVFAPAADAAAATVLTNAPTHTTPARMTTSVAAVSITKPTPSLATPANSSIATASGRTDEPLEQAHRTTATPRSMFEDSVPTRAQIPATTISNMAPTVNHTPSTPSLDRQSFQVQVPASPSSIALTSNTRIPRLKGMSTRPLFDTSGHLV